MRLTVMPGKKLQNDNTNTFYADTEKSENP